MIQATQRRFFTDQVDMREQWWPMDFTLGQELDQQLTNPADTRSADQALACMSSIRLRGMIPEVISSEILQSLSSWILDTTSTAPGQFRVIWQDSQLRLEYHEYARASGINDIEIAQAVYQEWYRVYHLLSHSPTIELVFFVEHAEHRRQEFLEALPDKELMVKQMNRWIDCYHVMYDSPPSRLQVLESIGCYFLDHSQDYHENILLHLLKGTVIK